MDPAGDERAVGDVPRQGVNLIAALFSSERMRAYLGEPVTLMQHMLQAAALAEAAGAPNHLVAAALLHDVGHVRQQADADDRHADRGADWLAKWFPARVTEPVRLHVAAKRYLCAVEPAYFSRLSEASVRSLAEQGGPMSPSEVQAFERQPYMDGAVAVRRWDEVAKDPSAAPPEFEHFRPLLQRLTERTSVSRRA